MTEATPDPSAQAQEGHTDQSSEPSPQGESPNIVRMREVIERLQTENTALQGVARQAAFKEAGIDPSTGLGKAIYRTYEGEIDPTKIVEFAQAEYDWEAPAEPAVTDAERRIATVGNTGVDETTDIGGQIVQAEQAGDWIKAQALKDRQLLALAQRQNPIG